MAPLCSINTVYYKPFATTRYIPALLLGGNGIKSWFEAHPSPWAAFIIIFSPGVLAFCLNFSIFYVIHSTTAVTFNFAGNLKEVKQNQEAALSMYLRGFRLTNKAI
ncbi:hypothetical protein F2Q70_00044463 [Brassica cretica]|uniref:Uncharacterized protein n=1 Tax=Brassica cretica TaxID=69181 RepID=A0A8S9KPY3_BRACR|nr:hypothetical protein F2Q70_00044463 [Brassica cretica]KAF2607858.1 hypothetical protein F2Q68_00045413 [Brassica cretica]